MHQCGAPFWVLVCTILVLLVDCINSWPFRPYSDSPRSVLNALRTVSRIPHPPEILLNSTVVFGKSHEFGKKILVWNQSRFCGTKHIWCGTKI